VLIKDSDVGAAGDMVEVSNGFFRSYLEPQGLATKVSAELMAEFEKKAAEAAAAKAKEVSDAKALATALKTIGKFTVKKTVGEDGKIFGSVQASVPQASLLHLCLRCAKGISSAVSNCWHYFRSVDEGRRSRTILVKRHGFISQRTRVVYLS
jgi:hypothetical protein